MQSTIIEALHHEGSFQDTLPHEGSWAVSAGGEGVDTGEQGVHANFKVWE